jgi:acetoacetyl-CoA reductase
MFKKMTKEQWDQVMSVNLDGVFNVTKQFFDGMLERGWGRVINISSVNGEKGQAGQTNYSSTKAAIYGFTKSLAQECANKGITVNAISPGYIGTEMVKAIREDILQKIVDGVPMKRLGTPEEIADLVGYLSSDSAAFITGANISINGGLHM